ncbi:recombinase family protein [Fibrivirga algicola]|uniref:recombinase family protein n=1 Tax=Fibrivirga algicola TaxID=2950420 RepID=UPI00286E8C07|nr:recombinase family protein [Fibrivirga algicola]
MTVISTNRPALDRMLTKLRLGDTVMVARFTRLGRSRDYLITLMRDFVQQGIRFQALDLGVDSSTPAGKLVLDIFAALAEYDRESINERTRAGRELAKEKGTHMGRPAGIDPVKLLKVRRAMQAGLSVAETVNLTEISETSVKRYRKLILQSQQ